MRLHVRAVVELTADLPRPHTQRLVRAAYRASRSGPVALVLRGVHHRLVDAMLDAEVVATGIDVSGVMYVDEHDEALIASLRRQAEVVITLGDPCCTSATLAEAQCSVDDAEQRLAALGRPSENLPSPSGAFAPGERSAV